MSLIDDMFPRPTGIEDQQLAVFHSLYHAACEADRKRLRDCVVKALAVSRSLEGFRLPGASGPMRLSFECERHGYFAAAERDTAWDVVAPIGATLSLPDLLAAIQAWDCGELFSPDAAMLDAAG